MPRYTIVGVRTREEPMGFAIVELDSLMFESRHLYTYDEATELLQRLEESAQIKENWPDPNDPEVVALLNDQTFKPIGQNNVDVLTSPVYRLHMAAETIARRRAGLGDITPNSGGGSRG